jgi:hypothetical protein
MADDPIGPLAKSPMFWHLDEYATRAAADADHSPRWLPCYSEKPVISQGHAVLSGKST